MPKGTRTEKEPRGFGGYDFVTQSVENGRFLGKKARLCRRGTAGEN